MSLRQSLFGTKKAAQETLSLNSLPDDMIKNILSFFSHQERMRLQTVSKFFRFNIFHTPIAESSITLHVLNTPISTEQPAGRSYSLLLKMLDQSKELRANLMKNIGRANIKNHFGTTYNFEPLVHGLAPPMLMIALTQVYYHLFSSASRPIDDKIFVGMTWLAVLLAIAPLIYEFLVVPHLNYLADKKIYNETVSSILLLPNPRS